MGLKYNYSDRVRAEKRRALTPAKLASAEGTSLITLKAATLIVSPVRLRHDGNVRALIPVKLASAEGTS